MGIAKSPFELSVSAVHADGVTRSLIASDLPMLIALAQAGASLQLCFELLNQGLAFHIRHPASRQPSLGPHAGQHLLRTLTGLFQAALGFFRRQGPRTLRWLFLTTEGVILHGVGLLYMGVNPGLQSTGIHRLIDGTEPRGEHMLHLVTQTPTLFIVGEMHLPSVGIHTAEQQGDVGVGRVLIYGCDPFHAGMSGLCLDTGQQHPRHAWEVDQPMMPHSHYQSILARVLSRGRHERTAITGTAFLRQEFRPTSHVARALMHHRGQVLTGGLRAGLPEFHHRLTGPWTKRIHHHPAGMLMRQRGLNTPAHRPLDETHPRGLVHAAEDRRHLRAAVMQCGRRSPARVTTGLHGRH